MLTECEDLAVLSDMYQFRIKVIKTKGPSDNNVSVNWIYPESSLQQFLELKQVELGEMTLRNAVTWLAQELFPLDSRSKAIFESRDENVEALSVEISEREMKIRCCVAYGPQETDLIDRRGKTHFCRI